MVLKAELGGAEIKIVRLQEKLASSEVSLLHLCQNSPWQHKCMLPLRYASAHKRA
jgi:hypothetical protein